MALALAIVVAMLARPGGLTIGPVDTAYVEQTLSLPGSPQQVMVDECGGRVFMPFFPWGANAAGLAVYDTATGRLNHTSALPTSTVAASLDPAARRLYLFASSALPGGGSRGAVTMAGTAGTGPLATVPLGVVPFALTWDGGWRDDASVAPLVGNKVAVAADSDHIALLDRRTWRTLSEVAVGNFISGLALDERSGHLFAASDGAPGTGRVTMLDAHGGRRLRAIAVGAYPCALLADTSTGHVFVSTALPSTMAGYTALPLKAQGTLSMLDGRSGAVLRTISVGWGPRALALDRRTRRLFVLNSADGTVTVVDTASGRPLHTVALHRRGDALAVDERSGRVFVANSGAAAPLPDWLLSVPLPPPMSPPCAPQIPRYLAPGTGSISVLDAGSSRLLRTIRTGTNPSVLAVDEQAGRLLAGSAELFVPVDAPWHAALTQLRRWLPFLPSIGDSGTTWHVPARLSVIDAAR